MARYKTGLALGKFNPLHKGHELMIEKAIMDCEEVFIIISGRNTDKTLTERFIRLLKMYEGRAKVSIDIEKCLEPTFDQYGTVKEEWYWNYTINKLKEYNVDAVFTNDLYGKKLAKLLNADWKPCDVDREIFPISGTNIRHNFYDNFDFIAEEFKSLYSKKIALVGPESVGKSTLSKQLMLEFPAAGYVHEYARFLCEEQNNDLDVEDYFDIMDTQNLLVEQASKFYPIVISDSEATISYLYSLIWFGTEVKEIKEKFESMPKYDHYIILEPTVPWVDDGTRVMSSQLERDEFTQKLIDLIPKDKQTVISSTYWSERKQQATYAIGEIINEQ